MQRTHRHRSRVESRRDFAPYSRRLETSWHFAYYERENRRVRAIAPATSSRHPSLGFSCSSRENRPRMVTSWRHFAYYEQANRLRRRDSCVETSSWHFVYSWRASVRGQKPRPDPWKVTSSYWRYAYSSRVNSSFLQEEGAILQQGRPCRGSSLPAAGASPPCHDLLAMERQYDATQARANSS